MCKDLRHRGRLLILLLLALLMGGCTSLYEDPDNGCVQGGKTVIYVSMAGKQMPNVRAQGEAPSIDSDATDYEDYVDRLAVLIYDATTGNLFHRYFTSLQNFVMELEPVAGAKYHFCFVANYPSVERATLEGLDTYTKFQQEMKKMTTIPTILYDGAVNSATSRGLFPMARVYENQTIPAGGSAVNPKPFIPTRPNPRVLSPVSSWEHSWEEGINPSQVNLVRTVAKVSLQVSGAGLKDVSKIEMVNVPQQQSYMEQVGTTLPTILSGAKLFVGSNQLATAVAPFQTKMYIPENLLGTANVSLGWNTTTDTPIGKPVYIQITMKSGMVYKLPMVTNVIPMGVEYLDVARNVATSITANYSIVRNNHYHLDIVIPEDVKKLRISYQVMPWTLFNSEMSYERPEYDFRLFIGLHNQVTPPIAATYHTDINQEVELQDLTPATIYFKINKPVGKLWQASITNGHDFTLTGNTQSIVGASSEWYRMVLTPKYPFETQPHYTHFYITIDGQELYLGFKVESVGASNLVLDQRFIGDGTPAQWKFKQVRNPIN